MSNKQLSNVGLYTRTLSGHRQSYLDFVKQNFGGEKIHGLTLFLKKGPVFFLMIEDNFMLYFFVACIRAFLGKKTAGLLFRPKPALQANNFKLKIKLHLLKLLKKNSKVRTLSIVPVPLEPEIAEIVDDWIYDFQLWDITNEQKKIFEQLKYGMKPSIDLPEYQIVHDIKKYANGRPIVIALGVQNKAKGTHILADNIQYFFENNYCVVVAGRFSSDSEIAKKPLEEGGALIFDRFVTDEEILGLYAAADAVWCFYDPSYDQASGILGRAVQLGVLPIVRLGSFSEKFCLSENVNHLARHSSQLEQGLKNIDYENFLDAGEIQKKLKEVSVNRLNKIFYSDREE
ncbi:MAG: hypothetical protein RR557_07270 [Bacilli bacterium]